MFSYEISKSLPFLLITLGIPSLLVEDTALLYPFESLAAATRLNLESMHPMMHQFHARHDSQTPVLAEHHLHCFPFRARTSALSRHAARQPCAPPAGGLWAGCPHGNTAGQLDASLRACGLGPVMYRAIQKSLNQATWAPQSPVPHRSGSDGRRLPLEFSPRPPSQDSHSTQVVSTTAPPLASAKRGSCALLVILNR